MSAALELRELLERAAALAERLPEAEPARVGDVPRLHVTEKRMAELSGRTVPALATMRQRGVVTHGVHWRHDPAGKVVWDVGAFERWQNGESDEDIQASKSDQTGRFGSDSKDAAGGHGARSTSRRRRPGSGAPHGFGPKSLTGSG